MDGASVWFGRNKGRSVLDHNWTTADDTLKLHVLATCAPKLSPNFRSYDLVINGQLFASLSSHNYFGGFGDAEETEPPEGTNDKNNISSIIQVLFPDGYKPPTRNSEQPKNTSQQGQSINTEQYPVVTAVAVSSNGNGISHPPVVDLLVWTWSIVTMQWAVGEDQAMIYKEKHRAIFIHLVFRCWICTNNWFTISILLLPIANTTNNPSTGLLMTS